MSDEETIGEKTEKWTKVKEERRRKVYIVAA
jgi:hypothetical protein